MKYDPEKHHRRSIRLKGYDYSQAGAYFITIVTQDRACLFGEVVDGEMRLNDAGRMVWDEWDALPDRFPGLELDAFVVMPNHVHGIIVLTGSATVGAGLVPAPDEDMPAPDGVRAGLVPAPNEATTRVAPTIPMPAPDGDMPAPDGVRAGLVPAPLVPALNEATTRVAPTIGDIVGAFKSITTVAYIRGVKQSGWPPFRGRVWQRNYYEHIIRNEESLNRIRQYIADNPLRWAFDRESLLVTQPEPEDEWRA
ncbi:transposase [uncultured Chloroflexus sp.]|uniref:transposase n=1 Tax=uncultured Chloroflexus sp. TaxID=214040 RepID=UPI0026342809|nr:transposase [uncultured Chloroflexus sp.]